MSIRFGRLMTAGFMLVASSVTFVAAAAVAAPCASETLSEVDAASMARRCDSRIEISTKRTEHTQTWANPDGTRTFGVSFGAARVKRGGVWQDVDLNLERKPDGSIGSKVHPVDVRLGRGAELATIAVDGQRIGYGWQGALPTPVLDGAKATYPEVRPGVDLVVEVSRSGFETFLVVKDRAAAAQVAEVRMPMHLGGSVAVADVDGSVAFVPLAKTASKLGEALASGSVVAGSAKQFTSARESVAVMPTPLMWDDKILPGTGEREKTKTIGSLVRATAGGGAELVLSPDMAFLTDPATSYPVTLDPAIHWTRYNDDFFDTWVQNTFANTDNTYDDELKFGWNDDGGSFTAYSYLQFNSSPLNGVKVHSARLRLYEHHSWSCRQAGWHAEITAAVGTGTRWANKPAINDSASRSTSTDTTGYSSSCPAGYIYMTVTNTMQKVADRNLDTATIGLKGATMTNHDEWKRAYSADSSYPPFLEVDYNHIPGTPSATQLAGEERCHSGAGVRQYVSDSDPLITAVVTDLDSNSGTDADAQLLRARLQINNSAGTAMWTQDDDVALTTGNRAFFDDLDNPTTSGVNETLVAGAYGYQLAVSDSVDWSPWTAECEFEVVTDIPDSVPTVSKGTKVNGLTPVTFSPAAGDETEVAGYRFGLAQDRLASYVAAGPSGAATVQLAIEGNFTTKLFARAVNKANAPGPIDPVGTVVGGAATANRVAGDINGDGRSDVVGLADVSAGRVQPYVLFSDGSGGFNEPVHELHGDVMGSYKTGVTQTAVGDFDADGRSDVAVLTDDSGVKLKILRSDGIGLIDQNITWTPPSGTTIAKSKVLAADFNGDGKDDVLLVRESAPLIWQAWVYASTSSGVGTITFDAPAAPWYTNCTNCADFSKYKWVVGKFAGDDNLPDIANFYDYGNGQTKMWTHKNLGSTFEGGIMRWDGGTNNVFWANADFTATDYTGDGRTDIFMRYDYTGCQTKLWAWAPDATGAMPLMGAKFDSGPMSWCSSVMELKAGDYNADGIGDVGTVYHCCGFYQKKAWTFASTGSALSAPALGWEGGLGVLNIGDIRIDTTKRYELVNVNSGKCVVIPSGVLTLSTQLVQQSCDTAQVHKSFTVTRDGAGQQVLRPAHNTGMCVDVDHAYAVPGTKIWQYTCNGGGAQRWQMQYQFGLSGSDPAVRIVLSQTGMCMDVTQGGTADGVLIQEWTCNSTNSQNFYLRQVP